jgi:hypothetical protein
MEWNEMKLNENKIKGLLNFWKSLDNFYFFYTPFFLAKRIQFFYSKKKFKILIF